MHKQSKTRNSFATSHRQADVKPCPGKQGSSCVMVSWEGKHHDLEHPPLPPSVPQLLLLSVIWIISSVHLGQLSQPPCWQGSVRSRKDLATTGSVLTTIFIRNPKPSIIQASVKSINYIPSKTRTPSLVLQAFKVYLR